MDAGGRVVFGATVDLEDEDSGAKVTYQIVGDDEADLKQGPDLDLARPIARALIGKAAATSPRCRRRAAFATTRSSTSATSDPSDEPRPHRGAWLPGLWLAGLAAASG